MLGRNLKYLRQKSHISQQVLADFLEIPRSTLGDYERGNTEPSISMLIRMSEYFDTKVDQLIAQDLSHSEYEILKTQVMKVLAISVDAENESHIELVDSKAEAGYLDSYQNPEYIRELPKIHFPNIPRGTYRGFEIQGDSMLPIESGSIIIAAYIENIDSIKDDKTYIVITKKDGLVYKRVEKKLSKNQLKLSSDNDIYEPFSVALEEVDEIWQYYAHISFSDTKPTLNNAIEAQINDIQKKVTEMRSIMS